MAKKTQKTVTKQSDGTIVVSSKVSALPAVKEWSGPQCAFLGGVLLAASVGQGVGLGVFVGEWWSFLTLVLTPVEGVFVVKGIDRFNKVDSFFKKHYFKKPSRKEVAEIAFGLKKKNEAIRTGSYSSDMVPDDFESDGSRRRWSSHNEFYGNSKEYNFDIVLNRNSDGLVMEQRFIPKPITLWDDAFMDARTLHNV